MRATAQTGGSHFALANECADELEWVRALLSLEHEKALWPNGKPS